MSDTQLPTPYAVHHTHDGDVDYYTADQMRAYASEAVRAALAAQGEPVAWMVMNGICKNQLFAAKAPADALCTEMQKRHDLSGSLAAFHVQPLYTAPPAPAKPMTRKQAMAIVESNPDTMTAIRMTEAHHGITDKGGA